MDQPDKKKSSWLSELVMVLDALNALGMIIEILFSIATRF
jgi:hypothetical protein